MIEIISWICLALGSFFCFSGAIGLLRFPDFFSRMHASSVTDTLGAGLILLGLMFYAGLSLILVKLLLILVFLLLTGPTSAHAMSKAALHSGHIPITSQNDETEANAAVAKTGGEASKS